MSSPKTKSSPLSLWHSLNSVPLLLGLVLNYNNSTASSQLVRGQFSFSFSFFFSSPVPWSLLSSPSGNRILTLGEVPKDQVYGVKLKGVSVCFTMLKAVLSGNYVNFGVFRLYGDDALDNALQTFIKLLLSIPHSDLLVRPLIQHLRDSSFHKYSVFNYPFVAPCRTTLNSVNRSTPCWRFWRRTTWTSLPVWSLTLLCISCPRYQKDWRHSVRTRTPNISVCYTSNRNNRVSAAADCLGVP